MFEHPATVSILLSRLKKNQYLKVKRIAGLTGLTTSAETVTGFTLPENAVVLDVLVDVKTAVSGKTIDVGTDGTSSNDPNGFAAALSVATTGIKRPGVALDGTNNWYASTTRGALLAKLVAGSNADDRGLNHEFPDLTSGGEKVTYTPESATAALVFDLYIIYAVLAETYEI